MTFIDSAFDKFAKNSPISVMARATLENVLTASRLDEIFEQNAEGQYTNDLLFSTVADIMGEVVLRVQPSVNAAYRDRQEEIGVTVYFSHSA